MEKLAEFKRILFEFINLLADTPYLLLTLGGIVLITIIYKLGYIAGEKKAKK